MIDEANLRDVLTGLAMETRSAFVMSASILNELAALRETVRDLDPTFADVIEQRRKEAEARGAVEVARVLAGIDEMIEQLKSEDELIIGEGVGELVNEAKSPYLPISMSGGLVLFMPQTSTMSCVISGKKMSKFL
jgi:hypothetical protein